jgi:hypothetical protein
MCKSPKGSRGGRPAALTLLVIIHVALNQRRCILKWLSPLCKSIIRSPIFVKWQRHQSIILYYTCTTSRTTTKSTTHKHIPTSLFFFLCTKRGFLDFITWGCLEGAVLGCHRRLATSFILEETSCTNEWINSTSPTKPANDTDKTWFLNDHFKLHNI